jgi:hypothetical protein
MTRPLRLPGSPDNPHAPARRTKHEREALIGAEKLLLAIASLDLDPRALRAAAALVHHLDVAARERNQGARHAA